VDGARLGDRRRRHGDHHCRLALGESRFSIAVYTLLPFGYKAVPRDEYFGREDVGTGPLGVIGNIVWLWLTWARGPASSPLRQPGSEQRA
jgi:hypothetical protein